MSGKRRWRRTVLGAVLAGGILFSGPCGITTLQAKDFLQSALIRTTVTTLASVLEAATIDAATEEQSSGDEQ